MQDEEYMRRALTIARYAEGRTSPNPLVGALVVRGGRVVGQGWHRKAGTPHAEVHALRQAGDLARGATMYVTLEPCSHYGRTPPCSQLVIDSGIKRVVVAMTDPNPLVSGSGIQMMKDAGIEVKEGVLAEQARHLNEVFIKWITAHRPFVVLKTAMSLDGKIATSTGESQWITSETSRLRVHQLRDCYDAVLAGIGTVLADDPSLTVRLPDGSGKKARRIIVDSMARTPIDAAIVTDHAAPTLIAVTGRAPEERVRALEEAGAEVLKVNDGARVDLSALLTLLGRRNITSVFVEGGAAVNASFIEQRLVDKVHVFIAPLLIGGKTAPTPISGDGAAVLTDALRLERMSIESLDGDLMISGYAAGKGE